MVESAYTGASKASARKGLRVRVPLPAPLRGGVLAERARRVGVHAGRGAEPPGTPAFRHVAGRAVPAWGARGAPGPRHPHVRCRPEPPDLVTIRALPARAPWTSAPHVRCRAEPPDLVTVHAAPARAARTSSPGVRCRSGSPWGASGTAGPRAPRGAESVERLGRMGS